MSAPEHLGQQFSHLVEEHAKRYRESYSDPEICVGECSNAAADFEEAAYHHGVRGVGHEVYEGEGAGYHAYNSYRGHAVDWTARQFFPTAEVPHVEPLKTYTEKLRKVQFQ